MVKLVSVAEDAELAINHAIGGDLGQAGARQRFASHPTFAFEYPMLIEDRCVWIKSDSIEYEDSSCRFLSWNLLSEFEI